MTTRSRVGIAILAMLLLGLAGGAAGAQDLPLVKGKRIVASVNGEPITLDEFMLQIASLQQDKPPGEKVGKQEEAEVLTRMITTRLIAQEARQIGLDKLPEVRKMVESFSRVTLRDELAGKVTKGVKADEGEVEKQYAESAREWRISAVFCEQESDAKGFLAEVTTGKDFRETAKAFLADRRAKGIEEGVYLKPSAMDPQLRQVASGMAVGSISPVIRTGSGFVVLRLEDVRTAEDPAARERARQVVLTKAKLEAVRAYNEALKTKYVKIHDTVLKSIDFEASSPGMEALRKDTRVLAEIKGEQPVTVGELTEELRFESFHGVEMAAERKRLNAKKEQILEGLLHRKVFRKEALRQGLDKTESYRSKVKEYEVGVLFGVFLKKVIAPDVKLTEDEIKAYYAAHQAEYSAPAMVRMRGLVFGKRADAESALEKLRAGTEYQWLATHAEGQVDRATEGVLSFDGRPLIAQDLPEGVRKAIAGVRTADSRLYASPEGLFYVLEIQDVVAPKPVPYEEARQEIAGKILEEKARKAMEEYAGKLRALADVKVYLKS